jgi:uncharacterized protein (PEP-CTERM system associated)
MLLLVQWQAMGQQRETASPPPVEGRATAPREILFPGFTFGESTIGRPSIALLTALAERENAERGRRNYFDIYLTVAGTASSNITLTPDKESDFVTEVNPSVFFHQEGKGLDLDLGVELQNVFYARNSDSNRTNPKLQGNATADLYKERLFLDADASIRRRPIASDRGPIGDGLTLNDNQTNTYSYILSPYWRQDLGGYMTALARYGYGSVKYDGGDNPPSDSETNRIELDFTSGRRFSSLDWDVSYSNRRQRRQDASNDNRENLEGNLRERINSKWAIVTQAGYRNDDVENARDLRNGGYWSIGPEWTPSRFIELRALAGYNEQLLSLRLNPTVRTGLEITYRNLDVGVNPGKRWFLNLNHRTRFSTWSANYSEQTTNTQQLALTDTVATIGTRLPEPISESSRTDQTFFSKRFRASVGYVQGRSDLGLQITDDRREFERSIEDERIIRADAFWAWRFTPRTRSVLATRWLQNKSTDRTNNNWEAGVRLEHLLARDLSASLGYRYYRWHPSGNDEEVQENRLQLFVSKKF